MRTTRSNRPGLPEYEIPPSVVDLLEHRLGCRTGGRAKHGLRWERDHIGVVFFEFPSGVITLTRVNLYLLPTGVKSKTWKTVAAVRDVLEHVSCSHLWESVQVLEDGKHVRILDVSWNDVLKVLPQLIPWSFAEQGGRPLR